VTIKSIHLSVIYLVYLLVKSRAIAQLISPFSIEILRIPSLPIDSTVMTFECSYMNTFFY
ncbi:uncharacterized protein METZ01_LOCUS57, partial [marine metagenome]